MSEFYTNDVDAFVNNVCIPITSHLKFSIRAISITAPHPWNDLPPELSAFSVFSPSLKITHHHPPAPLSITPKFFQSKLRWHLIKNSHSDSPDPLSFHSAPKLHLPLSATLLPLTLWQPDLKLPWTVPWTTPLILHSARE